MPMRERLDCLRANGFMTYIASGGGVEFPRAVSKRLYGVPPEKVIGWSIKTRYELRDGKPVIMRLPEFDFIDDKVGKPMASTSSLAAGRSPRSATRTGISRCWST